MTNVANFGAFIDIGVHQDGLAHVSALADRFVKDPREVVKVGQVVKVKVLEVDLERRRIALTLRLSQALAGEQERQAPAARRPPSANGTGAPGSLRWSRPSGTAAGKSSGALADAFARRDGTSDAGREPPKRCSWRSVFPVGEQVVLVAELFVLVVAQVVRLDFIVGAGPVFRRFDGLQRQLVPGVEIHLFQPPSKYWISTVWASSSRATTSKSLPVSSLRYQLPMMGSTSLITGLLLKSGSGRAAGGDWRCHILVATSDRLLSI